MRSFPHLRPPPRLPVPSLPHSPSTPPPTTRARSTSDRHADHGRAAPPPRALSRHRESLFSIIDTDKSGTIERPEFDTLYDMVRTHVQEEIMERQGLVRRVLKSRRRVAALLILAVVLLVFLCVSVAGNAAAVFYIVDDRLDRVDASGVLVDKKTEVSRRPQRQLHSVDGLLLS